MAFYRYTYYKFEKHKHLYVRFFVGGNPVWKSQANAVCEDVLLEEASPVDSYAYASRLHACSNIRDLMRVHASIFKAGLDGNIFLGTKIAKMYAIWASMENARLVFDKIQEPDGFLWNVMIRGYAINGPFEETMVLYHKMRWAGVQPDNFTFPFVLKACAILSAFQEGKEIHDHILRSGFESDMFVETALVNMYSKCGILEIAHQLFDKMSKRNVVSWNAMIAGYAQNGHANEALTLFTQMQLADMKPDLATILSVVHACAHLAALRQGKWIHGYIIASGFESDVSVGNSLIAMYAKCGSVNVACRIFNEMHRRDVVSWNAMIVGYIQNGHATEALRLFREMQLADVTADSVSMLGVLQAYSQLGALQQGKVTHGYVIRRSFELDVVVGTTLIDMYAKCGSIDFARQLFEKMSKRNVVSWSAMIAGYAQNRHANEALALFNQMLQANLKFDSIAIASVLYACGALLGACRIHCNIDLGERVAEHIFYLEPENAGCYVLLSNIYAAAGRWNDVAKVRTLMKDKRVKKIPGCSSIEVNSKVHTFLVGDRSHPQSEKIYAALETLYRQMKEAGYVPDTSFVLQDVEEEVKEHLLLSHSEKLAITFGLINTSPGTPIQITKNLRVCGDCHSATKFISKIIRRDIIVRDANRFHHFKDGLCSCGNYW